MKNLKKVLFVVVFILIAFVGGMFFANKQTEPEITSTLIQNRIEQASDLVTTKYHYAKVGKFENSLSLNGWSIPLTNKNFILTFEGEIQLGTDLSKANIEVQQMQRADDLWLAAFDSNIETIDALQTGAVDTLIVQNTYGMGYFCVESAYKLLAGQESSVEKSNITATRTITRENMFAMDKQKALFPFG